MLLAAGIEVTATDASSRLATLASQRIGRPVRVMRFDELNEVEVFDGVWANACLLHVPFGSLASVLSLIRASLRVNGILFASFKGARVRVVTVLVGISTSQTGTSLSVASLRRDPGPP